jgi:type IV pilus assembly protein PilM
MFRLNRPHIQPIGVDLGHDGVKLLQLAVTGRSLTVHAAARRSLDISRAPASELVSTQAIEAVRDLLRGGNFYGRNAVVALPRQIVMVKNLRLPQMPASELAAVVQFEAHNILAFDGDEMQIEFIPAGEVRQGNDVRQEVIVLAARRTDIDRFVELVHRTGLMVESLDIEPCALYRGIDRFVRRREDEQEVHVMIDLGMQRSQVLIGKGRDISFFKTVDIGGSAFNEAVSRKLGITVEEARTLRRRLGGSDEGVQRDPVRQAVLDATRSTMEDLAKEVSLCMRYYSVTFRGQRPARVRLFGGEAVDQQLLAILNFVLSVPVEAGRPLFSVNCDAMKDFDRHGPSAEWAMALGLGLKRTEGKFAPKDGTPRATQTGAAAAAEVVDINAAAVAPAAAAAAAAVAAQPEHFAAIRRATAGEAARA